LLQPDFGSMLAQFAGAKIYFERVELDEL